jgi:hypothetical protein
VYSLRAQRVSSDDDLLHVREECPVVEIPDESIQHSVGRSGLRVVRVLVVATRRPLRAFPDQSTGSRTTTSGEAISPRISNFLVVTCTGGQDGAQERSCRICTHRLRSRAP